MEEKDWEQLKPEQKKQQLYLKQKDLLDTFLSHHAISQAQEDKEYRGRLLCFMLECMGTCFTDKGVLLFNESIKQNDLNSRMNVKR